MAEISFDKYIDNPSGGSVFTNRNMYKAMYAAKFDKVLVREQGRIRYVIYKVNDAEDTFFIHFKIPSEVVEKFYYDVVIKLYTTDNRRKSEANLRRYSVKFYSNDPAFVYTFAHSFRVNDLFIEELRSKMMKKALKEKAEIKNPKDNVWYVKSLVFAYLVMEKYGLFQRSMLEQRCKKYSKKDLLRDITPADIKVKDRQREQEKINDKKRREKEAKERERIRLSKLNNKKSVKTTSMVGRTRNTKTSRSTKTTKRV